MKILMADDLLVLNALKTILEKNNIEVMGYYTNRMTFLKCTV